MPASVLNARNCWRNTELIRWLIFFSIAIIGTAGDLISKTLTYQIKELEIIPGILRFNFVLNKGIIWGIASQGSIFFVIIPALAIPLILLIFKYIHLFSGSAPAPRSNEDEPAQFNILITIAFGLIMAGAVGNLYDRIFYKGVRDFIDFYCINWPIFNLADIYITFGVILIIIDVFRTSKTPKTPPVNQETNPLNSESAPVMNSADAKPAEPASPAASAPEPNGSEDINQPPTDTENNQNNTQP